MDPKINENKVERLMKSNYFMRVIVALHCLIFSAIAHSGVCEGESISMPDATTFAHVESLAKAGNVYAQSQLGLTYFRGIGVDSDQQKALLWLEKSIEGGGRDALYIFGQFYLNAGRTDENFRKASALFKRASDQGCTAAQTYWGMAQFSGNGAQKNVAEGLRLITEAAEAGDVVAQVTLGAFLITGDGVDKDISAGFNWIKRAASASESIASVSLAQLALANSYIAGIGTDPDPEKARVLAEAVYAKKDDQAPMAAYLIGRMYEEGMLQPRNLVKAFSWMLVASEYGASDSVQRFKSMLEKMPKLSLKTECSVYNDHLFVEHGTIESFRAQSREIIVPLQLWDDRAEVYFPERHKIGYMMHGCPFQQGYRVNYKDFQDQLEQNH